jgi:hypothetical protein
MSCAIESDFPFPRSVDMRKQIVCLSIFLVALFFCFATEKVLAQSQVWQIGISQTSINVRGTPVVVGQKTITAPSSGTVVVTFDGYCYSSVGDRIVLAASNTTSWGVNDGSVGVKANADSTLNSFSHTRAYAIGAGSYTYYAVAQNYVDTSGTGLVSIYASLTVKFFPATGSALAAQTGISQTNINVRGTPVVVGQRTITAPSSGTVVVTFDGYCYSSVGDRIVLAASNTTSWGVNDGSVGVKANADSILNSFSHTRTYAVGAGSYTYYAVAQNYVDTSGSGLASIYASLTVEFFPATGSALASQTGISQTSINVRGTPVVVGQRTITAPSSGTVVVTFDGYCYSSVGDRIVLAASSTTNWGVNDGSVGVKANAASILNSFSHTRTYAVGAGSYTYYAVAQNYVDTSGTGIASIYASLTVEFFPTATAQITVNTNPTGRSFAVDGTTYATAQTFTCTVGDSHTLSTTTPQSGASNTRYAWGNWSDGGAISHTISCPSTATTYTANFTTQYYLTMVAGTGGTVTPASGWYNSGQSVTIQANQNAGYNFSLWTGSGSGSYSGSSNPSTITMNSPITETANFIVAPSCSYTLNSAGYAIGNGIAVTATVNVTAPAGCSWSVTNVPSWITVNSGGTGTGNGAFNITIAANPGTVARYASLSIGNSTTGASYRVSDNGASCSCTVSPSSASYAASGGTGSFSVSTSSTCFFYLLGYSWITYNNISSYCSAHDAYGECQTGNVNYTVAANTGTQRSANLLMPLAYPVTQAAPVTTTQITVNTNPTGRSFAVDGTTYTTAQTFTWTVGDSHRIEVTTPQSGGSGAQYLWSNWSDGGAISHTITVPSTATIYTANFTTQYYLTMIGGTGGTVTPAPPGGWYNSGQSVSIQAYASGGYSFAGWAGSGSGSYTGGGNPATAIVNGPITEAASFSGSPLMTIRTNPLGQSFTVDGTTYTTAQTFSWAAGSTHTIGTTSPQSDGSDTRYVWNGWSDEGAISHRITVPSLSTTYTAYFTTQYRLATAVSPASTGVINPNPSSTDGFYSLGTTVRVTAVPNAYYRFSSWSGDLVGSANPQSVTMSAPRSVTANFLATAPVLTLSTSLLSFSYTRGTSVPAGQILLVTGVGGGVNFNATVSTASGGNWLNVTPLSGTTPASLPVTVNPVALQASATPYKGSVTVSAAEAADSPKVVEVRLTVLGEPNNPKPVLTRLGPAGAVAGGLGLDLQVYGRNFARGATVLWDGEELSDVTFLSSGQLRAAIPANRLASAKVVSIKVVNPEPGGGESGAMAFTVTNPVPEVTGLSLKSVIAGRAGYALGIYGANFVQGSVGSWRGAARTTQYVDGAHLVMQLQAGDIAAAGTGTVTVANPGGVASNGKDLEVVALSTGAPEIQRLTPDVIENGAGGFTLVVEGSGYQSGSTVQWNGQSRTTRYESSGLLTADILGSDAAGGESYLVTVTNPASGAMGVQDVGAAGGGTSNTGIVSNKNPVPLLEGLTPPAVVAGSDGFELRVTGKGYASGKTMVNWNGTALGVSYVSDQEVRVQIPGSYVGTEGTATVEVRNPSPGGGAQTKTFTITPAAEAKTTLLYPRLVDSGGAETTGVVIANLSDTATTVTAWAYDKEGNAIQGEQITNPVAMAMSSEEQQAIIDWQMFGATFSGGKDGWLKLESTEKKVTGFFMMFNDDLTFMDGANALAAGVKEFVLPEIAGRGMTEIRVANPNSRVATVNFELRGGDGNQKGVTVQRQIAGYGTLVAQIGDLFSGAGAGDYVRAVSDRAVVPLEYMGEKPKYIYALNGQDVVEASTVLYGPQYVTITGQWRTTLSVVNVDSADGTVTMRLINDEGVQIGATKVMAISAKGKLLVTDQEFFGPVGMSGYVEVRSNGPRLVGDIVFGDPDQETMASSLPLEAGTRKGMVFGHVVQNDTWWSGIALLNAGGTDAVVGIELYDNTGKLIRSKQELLKAGRREIGVLWQYFEELQDTTYQGYMKVSSDQGLAGFALFGTSGQSLMSAVPAQPVPAE